MGEKSLKAKFLLIDEMSDRFSQIADLGGEMLERFDRAGQSVNDTFSQVDGAAVQTAQSIDTVATSADMLGRSTSNTSTTIDGLSDALEEQERTIEDVTREIEGYEEGTERARRESEGFGEDSTRAIQDLSTILISAGIAKKLEDIVNKFMECSEAAAEFEVATAKISTVADPTKASMGELSSEIKALSTDTAIGVNALSEAAYQAISASVDTAKAVSFTSTATKLSVGGFTEAATAVDVLTTAINAYGLTAGDAEEISDMLITTQNLGKTSVDQLAQSVGKVIPLAAAYGVEMDNLSTAYAELTKGGIATAEAGTYLKAMLSELGDSASGVAGALKEETGKSFDQLMNQGYSLGDVLSVLGDNVGGSTTKFNELWSSSEAGIGALALFNTGAEQFNTTLDAMQTSTGATAIAYAAMTSTTVHAQEEMTNAAENLKIAIGEDLNPIMEQLYNTGTAAFRWAGELVEDNPAITAAVSAITVAVGVLTVGIVGFAIATTTSVIPAVTALTVAMMANPVFLIVTGVVALTAAVVAFVSVLAAQETEYETWTVSTQKQYDELQNLNSEYEEACNQYGETSEEALRLRYEVDDLTDSFEANKQTVEEFTTECDALVQSHDDLIQSYEQGTEEIRKNELGTLSLIQKLEDLATANDKTAGSEEQMKAIIDQLNQELPDLALSYEDVAQSTESVVEAMKAAAEAQAEQEKQAEQKQTYVDLLKEQAALEEQIAKAQGNLDLEKSKIATDGWYTEDSLWADWTTDVNEYKDSLDTLQSAYDENQAALQNIESDWAEVAEAESEAALQGISYEEAVSTALDGVKTEIEELAEAYDDAYEAARNSLDGSIGLFDTMSTKCETSTSEMIAALQNQTDYINTYAENLKTAAEYGLDDGLISSLSDGSEESAAYLNAIIGKIDELGGSTEEAKGFIQEMNTSFEGVQTAKDTFSTTVAEMETDFTAKMDGMEQKLQESITNMNMSGDAASAASATMSAYISSIKGKQSEAVSAAKAVAEATAAALSTTPTSSGVTTTVKGHARGTTNAEDVFIAGEDGPELILDKGGSTVFPAEETEKIIDSFQTPINIAPTQMSSNMPEKVSERNEKHIILEIAGSGHIEVGGGTSRETILSVMQEKMKPILMSIIQADILEEGDLSYDY